MLTGRFWPKTAVSALKQKHLTKKICRMQNQEMQNALESQPDRQTDRAGFQSVSRLGLFM